MYRRILSILGILFVLVSMTATSVFAMPDPPVKPAPQAKPFHPNYPPTNPQPLSQSGGNNGGVSAQAIAKGLPGTTFSYVSTFGQTDIGYKDETNYLNSPNGITVDSSGNVYVVEEYGARLLKFDKDKNFVWQVGKAGFRDWGTTGLNQPVGVTIAPDGNIWVTDQDHISKFDPSTHDTLLQFPDQPGNNGDDNTRFNQLRGIAFDSNGRMYLADGNRHRIQVFSFDGGGNPVYAATIGQTDNWGNSNSQFNWPDGIVIDSSNHLFVADRNNNRIQKCTKDDSTQPWGWSCSTFYGINGQGNEDNQLNNPGGLWIDKSDNLYIADTNNNRIMKCTSAGSCNELITNTGNVATGVVDSDGQIFLTLYDQSQIAEYNPDGGFDQYFAGTPNVAYETSNDPVHPMLNGPRAIDVDAKGNIIMAEEWGNRLIKLSPTGTVLWSKGTAGQHGWVGDPNKDFSNPQALALDKAGNIYVAGGGPGGPNVRFYNPDGSIQKIFDHGWGQGTDNNQFENPDGIAVDASGNIYIADRDAQTVKEFNKLGVFIGKLGVQDFRGQDNGHFNSPAGLTTDSAGNLYVADHDNCRVQKFNKSRQFLMTIGTSVCGGRLDQMGGPIDVAVDAAGKVYVTEEWNSRVQVYDKTGAYLTTIAGNWGSNSGDMRNPSGIALDAKGNVYVSDKYNARIQKYAPGVPYWAQQNLDGFGKQENNVWSLASFKGVLFAGTWNQGGQGTQIFRKSSAGWEDVVTNGFDDGSNQDIDHMFEFKGFLYASSINCTNDNCSTSNGGQIWRSPDGYTWQPVVTDGFGDRNRNVEIFHFFTVGSQLCASTWPFSGDAEIWCSDSGEQGTWSQIKDDVFKGNITFPSAQQYNNVQFIGSMNSTGGKLYRKALLAGAGPAVWTDTTLPTSFAVDGFTSVESMAVYSNNLYVAFSYSQADPIKSVAIWRCHVCDGSDWILEGSNDMNNSGSSRSVSLVALKTGVYAIMANNDVGIQVWSASTKMISKDPSSAHVWTPMGFVGLGSSSNRSPNHNNSTAVVNGTLYFGTLNFINGGGVWKFCPTAAVCK